VTPPKRTTAGRSPDDLYIEEGAQNLTFVPDARASVTILGNGTTNVRATAAQLIHNFVREGCVTPAASTDRSPPSPSNIALIANCAGS